MGTSGTLALAGEDGYKFRGHGAIQLTWKKAYKNFASWLKKNAPNDYKDIITDPTLIDSDTSLFVLSAMWFWNDNGLNDLADEEPEKNDKIFKIFTKKINRDALGWDIRLINVNKLKLLIN